MRIKSRAFCSGLEEPPMTRYPHNFFAFGTGWLRAAPATSRLDWNARYRPSALIIISRTSVKKAGERRGGPFRPFPGFWRGKTICVHLRASAVKNPRIPAAQGKPAGRLSGRPEESVTIIFHLPLKPASKAIVLPSALIVGLRTSAFRFSVRLRSWRVGWL